jgi:hypothetical protein
VPTLTRILTRHVSVIVSLSAFVCVCNILRVWQVTMGNMKAVIAAAHHQWKVPVIVMELTADDEYDAAATLHMCALHVPEFKRMDGGTNARTHAASTRSCTLAFNSLSLLLRAVSKAVENYWNDVLEIITLVLKATKMMGFMVVHYDVKDFETQKVC